MKPIIQYTNDPKFISCLWTDQCIKITKKHIHGTKIINHSFVVCVHCRAWACFHTDLSLLRCRGPWQFTIKQQFLHSWLTQPARVIRIIVSQIWYFFTLLMVLSASNLRYAMACVRLVSFHVSQVALLNGGMMSVAPTSDSIFSMMNPLSTMSPSPGSQLEDSR